LGGTKKQEISKEKEKRKSPFSFFLYEKKKPFGIERKKIVFSFFSNLKTFFECS
jgi:hypothetical protein